MVLHILTRDVIYFVYCDFLLFALFELIKVIIGI